MYNLHANTHFIIHYIIAERARAYTRNTKLSREHFFSSCIYLVCIQVVCLTLKILWSRKFERKRKIPWSAIKHSVLWIPELIVYLFKPDPGESYNSYCYYWKPLVYTHLIVAFSLSFALYGSSRTRGGVGTEVMPKDWILSRSLNKVPIILAAFVCAIF